MKFKVTFKDPDGPQNCILEALNDFRSTLPDLMSQNEKEATCDIRYEALREALREWCEWSEYVTIEIDTEEGTATVVKP